MRVHACIFEQQKTLKSGYFSQLFKVLSLVTHRGIEPLFSP